MSASDASTIVDALFHWATQTPESTAFVIGGETMTYGRLREETIATAAGLRAIGLEPGERCSLLLPTGFDFIRTFFAAHLLGAMPVPLNPALPVEALVARLRVVRCDLVVGDAASLGSLAGQPRPGPSLLTVDELRAMGRRSPRTFDLPAPDAAALLFLTSGTTGEPRAGIRLHRHLLMASRARLSRLRIGPRDVFVGWMPLHHTMGLHHFVAGPICAGCPAYLVQPSAGNLVDWLETITRVKATVTSAPDFGYRAAAAMIDPADLDITSLRVATSGGEPVRLATIRQFEQKFRVPGVIRPMYGLSEAGGVTMLGSEETLRVDDAGRVGCGRALEGLTVEIVDEGGNVQPPGASGEIRLRGSQVFPAYFGDETATRQAMRDGWLYTGDAGALDADGHLFIHGRLRSLIKRGGSTIAPRELENAAETVEGVQIAAAVGVPRPQSLGTEDVVLVAEVDPSHLSADARTAIVRAITEALRKTSGLSPSDVVIVSPGAMPRTANGKVRHDELKRLYTAGAMGSEGQPLSSRSSGPHAPRGSGN